VNKAFIFDLDGVLINNEPQWEIAKKEMFIKLFGQEIHSHLGSTIGLNIASIHQKAVSLGAAIPLETLVKEFDKYAYKIYSSTPIADGVEQLGKILIKNNYIIGVISASPKDWMDLVLDRISFRDNIKVIISLHDRTDLEHKPEPDGYLTAIKELNSTPSKTLVLEDSNAGIQSGKSAGAYVIGLRQNLVGGYIQKGADIYVNKIEDVIKIVQFSAHKNT
jgi:beta-phosphoglucomutase-like phosphatase (HAD superfamily)